jgi:hypothetical protein
VSGEVFSGYEDEGDYGQERLLDAGWLSADEAKTLTDAAFKWIRLKRGIDYCHNGHATGCAANEVERAFIEVFGLDFMTKHYVDGAWVEHIEESQ